MDVYRLTNDQSKTYLADYGLLQKLSPGLENEIPPKWDDLARLHYLIRMRKPFHVLEFGSGFSTIVIAAALKENWKDYLNAVQDEDSDNPLWDKPKVTALESSAKWLKNTRNKLADFDLDGFYDCEISEVHIDQHNGDICHFYKKLPDIVPDFVYLDGPDPATVKGDINGISFQNPNRTVMAADLLKYESTLLPGFFMIVDGRSNNARFLQQHFKREFKVTYHQIADVTTFELIEPKLGIKNITGKEAYSERLFKKL